MARRDVIQSEGEKEAKGKCREYEARAAAARQVIDNAQTELDGVRKEIKASKDEKQKLDKEVVIKTKQVVDLNVAVNEMLDKYNDAEKELGVIKGQCVEKKQILDNIILAIEKEQQEQVKKSNEQSNLFNSQKKAFASELVDLEEAKRVKNRDLEEIAEKIKNLNSQMALATQQLALKQEQYLSLDQEVSRKQQYVVGLDEEVERLHMVTKQTEQARNDLAELTKLKEKAVKECDELTEKMATVKAEAERAAERNKRIEESIELKLERLKKAQEKEEIEEFISESIK